MTIETRPLHPRFGVEIVGLDVRRVDDATFEEIAEAFDEYAVLLFRGQTISDEEQVAFSRLDGKVAIHSFAYSRGLIGEGLLPPEHAAQVPAVPQALVRANPRNGRRACFVGSLACEIVGLPTTEARTLRRDLLEGATRPDLVYTHRWQAGDLVMWDNRCVLHRGRPWDESRYRRVMHRTTVAGTGPTAPDVPGAVIAPAREIDVIWGRAQLAVV